MYLERDDPLPRSTMEFSGDREHLSDGVELSAQETDRDAPQRGTIIAGMGDEVLLGLSMAIVSLATLFLLLRPRQRVWGLHPDQAQVVEDTRRDMGIEQPAVEINAEQSCPVCLGPLTYPVQTNCGHTFCAQCILSYWRHDQWPRATRCPVCRRQVTLLLADQRLAGDEGQALWAQVTDYNQRMSGQWRPLLHYLYDVPILLSHLWRNLFTIRGLLLLYKLHILLILVAVVLYLLSPFDLLPEIMLGVLGLVDDLVIVVCALVYISLVYRAHVANGMH